MTGPWKKRKNVTYKKWREIPQHEIVCKNKIENTVIKWLYKLYIFLFENFKNISLYTVVIYERFAWKFHTISSMTYLTF